MQTTTVQLSNGIRIELLRDGEHFIGIGKVAAGEVALRSGRRPMFVEIRTPDAVWALDFSVSRQEIAAAGVRIECIPTVQQKGIMDWMVHSVRNRYAAVDWTEKPRQAVDTRLRLDILPVTRSIGATTFAGFSYRYTYRSQSLAIYRMLDRGTWEPGGRAVGNEFWMRNCFTASRVPIRSADQFHATEWFLPSCQNPNVFQFLPLQTELQGFTFTCGRNGTLVTWAPQVAHIRSYFEKPRGKDEIVHLHEHAGDLAREFATSPVEVLWAPGQCDVVDWANLYEGIRELVHETLHQDIGLKRERITTYGQIDAWGDADLVRDRENGLPKLLEAGCKTIHIANHFENNMNVWGVGNVCCTVDYKVAESVGSENLKGFCHAAQAAGARVEMWGSTSVSSLTEIFSRRNGRAERIRFLPQHDSILEALQTAQAPFVRNPSNAIEADHYTPVFCVMNLREPVVREYWLQRWKQAHDEIGLGGVFLDSSFNLSSDKFHFCQNVDVAGSGTATADQVDLLGHYRPAREPEALILSQYRAHLELMAEMQEFGIAYCNEDLGVFGVHRHGPGIEARLDSLFMWTDCIASFDVPALRKRRVDPDSIYFRGLAYRMMWSLFWNSRTDRLSWHSGGVRGDFDRPTQWQLALLEAYSEVEALLHNRRILPDEAGVMYRAGACELLWAFRDLELPLGGERSVHDILSDTTFTAAVLRAARHKVYAIGLRPDPPPRLPAPRKPGWWASWRRRGAKSDVGKGS